MNSSPTSPIYPDAQPLLFDEPEPLGHNRAPNAAAVLGAAVGDCLATSLAFCLKKSRIDLNGLTAHVTTHVTRNTDRPVPDQRHRRRAVA